MAIRELARQYIIEDLISEGCVSGQMSMSEFVRKVFPKNIGAKHFVLLRT